MCQSSSLLQACYGVHANDLPLRPPAFEHAGNPDCGGAIGAQLTAAEALGLGTVYIGALRNRPA